MARPKRVGFDYFPFDVTFFDDIKVKKVGKRCGNSGQLAIMLLYSIIYQDKGYYMEFDEDTIFFLAEKLNVSEDEMEKIVDECLNVNIFDKAMFDEHQILTSHGIQRRFIQLWGDCRRRTKYNDKYIYKDYCGSNARNNGVNEGNAPSKTELLQEQTQVNTEQILESKVKYSKEESERESERERESSSSSEKRKRFRPPTKEEVAAYAEENGLKNFDIEKWFNYYEANGWMVGRNKMKSWRASVNYWDRTQLQNPYTKATPSKPKTFDDKDYSEEANRW